MAGGVGSRFWPLSRENKPKQFLDILGSGETLIQQTFNRFKNLCLPENILVVTSDEHKNIVREQLGIAPERILTEPFRKNTAPCIAYGSYKIFKENKNAFITVSPADHIISETSVFEKVINTGFEFASSDNSIVTIGIKPDKPETGFGYIQSEKMSYKGDIFKVKSFREKPDLPTAEFFLRSGDFFWNSGIFIWSAKTILKAFDDYLPDISAPFRENIKVLGSDTEESFIKSTYSTFRNISIDYGIIEKADNVFVISADMGWSDLGTWSSLYSHSKSDSTSNAIVRGNAHTFDCSNNLISITPGKSVILQGLTDYIVVETDDALLVIKKQDEQNIKNYLEALNKEK